MQIEKNIRELNSNNLTYLSNGLLLWIDGSQRDALYRSFNIISRYLLTIQLAEAIKVDVEFKNPLQITISISSVSLICELSASSEEMDCGKFVPVPVHIFFSVFPLFFLVSEIGKFCHQRELTSVINVADANSSTSELQNDEESGKLTISRCVFEFFQC